MIYEGVNFYPCLAEKSFNDFWKEVKHHFEGQNGKEKAKEVHKLLKTKYNPQGESEEKQEAK